MLKIAIPGIPEDTTNYFAAMQALGAEPVTVGLDCKAEEYDGLLLPGGGDVDPARYGQDNLGSIGIDSSLDQLQFTVLERFVQLQKPILGICRGHQVLNIYFGGTLVQDLPQAEVHRWIDKDQVHKIRAQAGTLLHTLYGAEFCVNSSHHQGGALPGKGLRFTAFGTDGVVEAMEHETLPIWGVQFHPERMCFAHARQDTVDGSLVLQHFLNFCIR